MGGNLATFAPGARAGRDLLRLIAVSSGLMLALGASLAMAQDGVPPATPTLPSTTQSHPRGADIVEPMTVSRVTVFRDGLRDSLIIGTAKIPDPRKREVGAFVGRDVRTGAMIRISDAVIIGPDGMRSILEFDPSAVEDRLIFDAGDHDVVLSRQGAAPTYSIAGDLTIFDIAALYDAAAVNPLDPTRLPSPGSGPRTALLTMRSTYPRGEVVDLVVDLVPSRLSSPVVRIVRMDTTRFHIAAPRLIHVRDTLIFSEQRFNVIAAVETGYGPRYVHTRIPARTRAPFTTRGWADFYYVDGNVRLERATHRWIAHIYGMSSLVDSDIAPMSHHQVAIQGDLRFEYGRDWFYALKATGRLTDKPHQEFSWRSADYFGSILVGRGHRSADDRGLESHRLEVLAGVRMGENRVIDVYQAGDRARGLGGEIVVRARRGWYDLAGFDLQVGGMLSGYAIAGRGARDAGFSERGGQAMADARLGREVVGIFAFAAARAMLRTEKAWYPRGDTFFMNDALISPAVGVEMRF
jgi:hypothetical protein